MKLYFILSFVFLFIKPAYAVDRSHDFLAEALLARVGREAVMLSDIMRFQDVNRIMQCALFRENSNATKENFNELLGRYIEEELIYSEVMAKKEAVRRLIANAIKAIHENKKCQKEWRALGKKYSVVWGSKTRPLEGEGMLVRELEKRLQVDYYTKTKIQGDRAIWLREAKVKVPIKLYLE